MVQIRFQGVISVPLFMSGTPLTVYNITYQNKGIKAKLWTLDTHVTVI